MLFIEFSRDEAAAARQAWAAHENIEEQRTNVLGMKLLLIPPGKFLMGHDDSGLLFAEQGQRVELARPFYLGSCEVTQGEFARVWRRNPSWFSASGGGKDAVAGLDIMSFPAECVTWFDAVEFCNKLSELEEREPYYQILNIQRRDDDSIISATVTAQSGRGYRLPTAAEWEYACRAGTTTAFYRGRTISNYDANFDTETKCKLKTHWSPTLGRTTKVGSYYPNAFGLTDMHGNVAEWCWDWLDEKDDEPQWRSEPVSSGDEKARIARGGSWADAAWRCQSTIRRATPPEISDNTLGFRVAADSSAK